MESICSGCGNRSWRAYEVPEQPEIRIHSMTLSSEAAADVIVEQPQKAVRRCHSSVNSPRTIDN